MFARRPTIGFLSELHGRYDVVLKFVARHPGCTNGNIISHVDSLGPNAAGQVGGYLKVLIERHRMIERRLPIFAKPTARRGRYYIRDNFLRAWLSSLANPVAAINFRLQAKLVATANAKLWTPRGTAWNAAICKRTSEKLVADLGSFDGYAGRFLVDGHRNYTAGAVEKTAIALNIPVELRRHLAQRGYQAQDLSDLTAGL